MTTEAQLNRKIVVQFCYISLKYFWFNKRLFNNWMKTIHLLLKNISSITRYVVKWILYDTPPIEIAMIIIFLKLNMNVYKIVNYRYR